MKRLIVLVFLVMMVVAPLSTVNAINLGEDSPHILADYMPNTVDFFAGSRIGEDFIAELDAISLALYEKLPAEFGVEPYELDDVLRIGLAEEGIDYDEVTAVLGNHIAVGLELNGGLDEDPNFYVIVEIEDQDSAIDMFLQMIPDAQLPEPVTEGDNIVYLSPDDDGKIIITPTHMVVSNLPDFNVPVAEPLSTNPEFTSTLETLPADTYNMLVYVSEDFVEATVEESSQSSDLSMMGLDPTDAGAAAFGATILSGDTFVLDFSVATASPGATSTVSMDFLNALPADTDAFIISTDLTGVYNNTIATVQTIAEMNGEEDQTAQIPMMFGMTGLDLEEDVLSWTTGSYGFFFGMDYPALINDLAENSMPTEELLLDFGLVIEATDAALAQNAAEKLGEFIATMGGNQDGITITQEDGLTSIVMSPPDIQPFEFEFVLTSTDDFLFLGTRRSYDAILSGNTLGSDPEFTNSAQYYLTDANTVWYVNSDGFLSTTIIPLAMMGPAIGNVFDNVVAELNGTTPDSSPAPGPLDMLMSGEDPSMIIGLLETFDNMFAHATISSSIGADGIARGRASLSVHP